MKTSSTTQTDPASDCSVKENSQGADSGEGASATVREVEIGGRAGLDPTRYGDWEKGGRCIDF